MLIRIFLLLFTILLQYSYAVETKVLFEGYTDETVEKTVYRSSAELDYLKKRAGLKDKLDNTRPDENRVVTVIIPDKSYYPARIKITGIETDRNGDYMVYYKVLNTPTVTRGSVDNEKKPLVVLEVTDPGIGADRVTAINEDLRDVVVVDNSINQDIKYSNVLKNQENYLFLDYFPLDKANRWTYERNLNGKKGRLEFEITSFAEGWSVFDNFFGKYNVGLKIDHEGELMVSTKNGIRPFYNNRVDVKKMNKTVRVGAGQFNRILVVKSSEKVGFRFKDIYAKDIGLIYHEHDTPSGVVKYSLISAKVKGRTIP